MDRVLPSSSDTSLRPATRRALFAAALTGAAGLSLAKVSPAAAANGSALILGTTNSATNTTTLNVASTKIGLTVKNTGGGAAMFFDSTLSNGVAGRTGNADAYGFSAANVGGFGGGAALAASGINNTGIKANTEAIDVGAVEARNIGSEAEGLLALDGVGGVGYAGFGDVFSVGLLGVDSEFVPDSLGLGVIGDGVVTGSLDVQGTLTKAAGSFRIDHPLDPENKWLYHSFVESPEMMNVYAGTTTLNAEGTAEVELPGYFDALNTDVRYQLTPIGAPMPELHVSQTVSGNAFAVAGGAPGGQVSWQVTGVRQDTYANENRIVPEVAKGAGAQPLSTQRPVLDRSSLDAMRRS